MDFGSIRTGNDKSGISLSCKERSDIPDFILGLTNDGSYLALDVDFSHAYCSVDGEFLEHIHGNALLFSDSQFDPSSYVESINVRILELEEWIASYFLWVNKIGSDDERSRYEKIDGLEYLTLFDTEHLQVRVERDINECLSTSGCKTRKYSILIQPKTQVECEEISERYILPLLSFFTFCFGAKVHLDSVNLKLEGAENQVQFLAPNIVSYYGSSGDSVSRHIYFPLSRVMESGLGFLEPWFGKRGNLSTAISLIVPLLEEKHQEPLFQFMVASSALEAIERDVLSQELESKTDFQLRVTRIVEAAAAEFLDDIGKKLEGRLRNGNQKGQRQNHRELVEAYDKLSAWVFSDPAVFVRLQAANRNNVFHANASGDKDILNQADMRTHARALFIFCYGLIAAVLGIPEDTVIDSFGNSYLMWSTLHAYQKLCELYSK